MDELTERAYHENEDACVDCGARCTGSLCADCGDPFAEYDPTAHLASVTLAGEPELIPLHEPEEVAR